MFRWQVFEQKRFRLKILSEILQDRLAVKEIARRVRMRKRAPKYREGEEADFIPSGFFNVEP